MTSFWSVTKSKAKAVWLMASKIGRAEMEMRTSVNPAKVSVKNASAAARL